ncbi:FXYD domain containing ion transport regulator 7 isoform X3 [Pseudoliparis swirei]|uniref:FXYD domain containing ion transport regulator 7 isoform X3 n=1 Tax=Pseudoliparis swirei TaxID=2059687 RepID=UPI0024BE68B6|nr:FXYD domain containing ion transport regulator 7 isoform X3 [Pseudoliparis swirei]
MLLACDTLIFSWCIFFSAEQRCCIELLSEEKKKPPEELWSHAFRCEELPASLSMKLCFQTEVTLSMFQLIWYPDPKDRGASSDCVENTIST